MDSEKKELRKIKNKRILIWTIVIGAIAVLVTIITIFSFIGGGSS
jgi:t-SNARE complex subunit (syntaxin)